MALSQRNLTCKIPKDFEKCCQLQGVVKVALRCENILTSVGPQHEKLHSKLRITIKEDWAALLHHWRRHTCVHTKLLAPQQFSDSKISSPYEFFGFLMDHYLIAARMLIFTLNYTSPPIWPFNYRYSRWKSHFWP